jgi:hypothetical protein
LSLINFRPERQKPKEPSDKRPISSLRDLRFL